VKRLRNSAPVSIVALATIAAMAMLLMAATILACGSSGGASDTTAAGVGETKTYTDPDYGYSFDYPESWKVDDSASSDVTAGGAATGTVGVYDPKGTVVDKTYLDLMMVSVYKLNGVVDDSIIPQLKGEIESVLAGLESQDDSMKVESALAETTVAGMKGYEVTYSFTKNETPTTSTLYFLFNGDTEYQLTAQASNENWETDQPIFDAMIASFRPGTAQ
jgi:hypothetical protein